MFYHVSVFFVRLFRINVNETESIRLVMRASLINNKPRRNLKLTRCLVKVPTRARLVSSVSIRLRVDSRNLYDHFPPRAPRLEPLERPRDARLVEFPPGVDHGHRFPSQHVDDLRELRAVLSGEYEFIVVALPSGQRADPLPRAAVDGDASTSGRDRLAAQVDVVLPRAAPRGGVVDDVEPGALGE